MRGKVRFACPHCATGYYGTSPRGHLEPLAFPCSNCRRFIHMDETVLEPVDADDDQGAIGIRLIPWIESGGLFSRWGRTVAAGVGEPRSIHNRIGGERRAWRAFTFLAIQSWVVALPLACCCGGFGVLSAIPPATRPPLLESAILMVAFVVLAPVALAIIALSAASFARIVPRVASHRPATIADDFAIICYSAGPLVVAAIPLYGTPIFVWWLIAAAFAVAEARPPSVRLGTGVAVLAGFIFPLLALVALVVAFG